MTKNFETRDSCHKKVLFKNKSTQNELDFEKIYEILIMDENKEFTFLKGILNFSTFLMYI